jgi:hypothetical protein
VRERESCRGEASDGALKCKPDLPAVETRRRSRRTVVCYSVAVQKGGGLELNPLSGVGTKCERREGQ